MLAMMLDPDADGESSDDSDDESPTGERAGAPGSSLQRAEPSRSGGPRRVQFKAAASTPSSPNADSPPQHSFEHEEPPLPATSATPSLLTAQLEQSGSVGALTEINSAPAMALPLHLMETQRSQPQPARDAHRLRMAFVFACLTGRHRDAPSIPSEPWLYRSLYRVAVWRAVA